MQGDARRALRLRMRQVRARIPNGQREACAQGLSRRALTHLRELGAHRVLLYASMGDELSTGPLHLAAMDAGMAVYLPVMRPARRLDIVRVRDVCALEKNGYGVPEPTRGECADIAHMDAVLVPGLAFDVRGYRLGYGAGYYDRLLAGADVYTIGVCYAQQIVCALPEMPWDVPVRALLTPGGIQAVGQGCAPKGCG